MTAPRQGRPPKPPNEVRTVRVTVLLTEREDATLLRACGKRGVAAMLREAGLREAADGLDISPAQEVNGFCVGDAVTAKGHITGFIESYGRYAAVIKVEPTTPQKLTAWAESAAGVPAKVVKR